MIPPEARPVFAPGVRLHEDRVRGQWVVQAPERMLVPDETALAVLRLIDGKRSVAGIAAELAGRYGAPHAEIAADVAEFLDALRADGVGADMTEPPLALLAELTHRCPLRCPYCSNPTDLARRSAELDAATWGRVFAEAASLGCLQVHLSGGEPLARRDVMEILAGARAAGLYTNLITSAALPAGPDPAALAAAGLDHVQLSVQDAEAGPADRIAGMPGAHARKLAFADAARAAGLALTLNVVVHRENLARLDRLVALALELGAGRLEIAHAQYHGWALLNRAALLPERPDVDRAVATVEAARVALRGRLAIDHVPPDHHAVRPKPCMGGWGRRFLVVTPTGRILPCHAAETLPGFDWPDVRRDSLRHAWEHSDAFGRYRGTAWMKAPCRGCPEAERDWGGCRCQAFALTGDAAAADPACALSPHHGALARTSQGGAFVPRG